MKLTEEAVLGVVAGCLFDDGAVVENAVRVEGIKRAWVFDPTHLAERVGIIAKLLAELPAPFHANSGGGWTFLNACNDRNGEQWTGSHRMMESLVCVGIAAGLAEWVLPKELWHALPGGMPYFRVLAPAPERTPA